MNNRLTPARVALLYAVFASLWIFASDKLLALAVPDPSLMLRIGTIKGFAFVLITTWLLYQLMQTLVSNAILVGSSGPAKATVLKAGNLTAIFLCLALIVPLFGFGISKIYGPRIQQAKFEDLSVIADLKAAQIETWLQERRDDADELAERGGFIESADKWLRRADADAKLYLLARMNTLDRTHGYEPVLLRADGRRTMTSYAEPDPVTDKIWHDLLKTALSSGKPQRSNLYRDSNGKIRLDYVVPLRLSGKRRAVGALVLRAPVERFLFPLIQSWPAASASAETVLVRREGDQVMFLNELRHRKGTALSLHLPLDSQMFPAAASILTDKPQTMEGIDYRGVRVLAASRPIKGTDWHLVAKVDRDEVMAILSETLFWMSLVALIAVMVVASAVLLLWRQQQRLHQMDLDSRTAEQDKLLKLFYDLPFIGMAISAPDSKAWLYANDHLCDMLGYSREELLQTTWADITHPDDLAANVVQFEQMKAGKIDGYTLEKRFMRKDGSPLFVNLDVKCSRGPDGKVNHIVAMIEDIAERTMAEAQLMKNEQALLEAQEVGGFGSYEYDIVNDSWTSSLIMDRIFGIDAGYARTAAGWSELIHPSQREEMLAYLHNVFEQHLSFNKEYRVIRPNDGEERWVLGLGKVAYGSDGTPLRFTGTIQDITERKHAEDSLRQAATVFESSHDGAIITDLSGAILAVNQSFMKITGYSEAELLGQNPRMFHSGRHGRVFFRDMWAEILEAGYWQGEVCNRRKNGETYPQRLTVSAVKNAQNETSYYVGITSDLSQLKQSETRLEHMAHYDPLTDLPNRLLILSHLNHALIQARRQHSLVGVIYLDLDRFKNINESLGYPVGDELLVTLTKRLSTHMRSEDMLARLGGDEFLLVLEHIEGPEDAAMAARSLLELLTQPFLLSGEQEIFIGASIGISIFPNDGNTADQLIQYADAAMHQAKQLGRNTYLFYTESLTRASGERLDMETRLRHAVAANQLRVHYQPQVDIATGRIIGAEALVRWQDPERGLIPPANFIPLAEESGLIGIIGEWVLKEACLQGKRWIEAGLPFMTMAVNLSPHQFQRGNIVGVVSRVLVETGFPADRLELELTESALMQEEENAVKMLHLLRALDIRLAIDDFGTGYSSLSYLKRFPLDILKIDKSFVDDIPFHLDDMEIAATIIAMGHSLGFKVMAEGVETIEQLNFLQQKGCDMYQGYLTSPPVPAEDFENMLRKK